MWLRVFVLALLIGGVLAALGWWLLRPAGREEGGASDREVLEELAGETEGAVVRETPEGVRLALPAVLFDFDRAEVRPEGAQVLSRLAAFLREHPRRRVRVEGHTDATGTPAYNLALSRQRALAVQRFLARQGIDSERVLIRAHGESSPIASNATAEGRQRNRRVEIALLPPEAG